MDSLDLNLHSSILTALASNLASSSTHDDLALLTDSFSATEPVTNGVVNGVLARLGVQGATFDVEIITQQQAEAIIAFADFAAASASSASPETFNRALVLLRSIPSWDVEANIGIQGSDEWALSDRLSFSLVTAVLALATVNAGERTSVLRAVGDLQLKILKDIASAPGHRVIGHLLPALNGLRRAFSSSTFTWTTADAPPSSFIVDKSALAHVTESITSNWDVATQEGRLSLATLARYSTSLKGLSAGLVPSALLECHEAVLLSAVTSGEKGGWKRVLKGEAAAPPSAITQKILDTEAEDALTLLLETTAMLEDEERTESADPYAFDILEAALKVATLASIASATPSPQLVGTIEGLLTETSIISDPPLQTLATECLQALAHAFPGSLRQSTKTIRRFILSPSAVFEGNGELSSPPALTAAAKCYASLISLSGDPGMGGSVIQSLFNHFTDQSGDSATQNNHPYQISDSQSMRSLKANGSRTESQKTMVSINVVHAVSTLAQELKSDETYDLVVSMLLQRLRFSDPALDGAIMYELGDLAQYVDASTFQDVSATLSKASKISPQDDALSRSILAAQTRLATSAASKPDLQESYLTSILSLIVDKGSVKGRSRTEVAQDLLDLVPVLDTFFLGAKLDPQREVTPDLVALFRSTWYLFVLSGFLSTPARIADWQHSALVRIAKNTPGLLMGARHDFIETQLEYNTVLKQSGLVLTPDAVRSELASVVPSQAGHIRTLSGPQAVFLATVLRLETLRAEAGNPSVILTYFEVEGVNESPLFTTLSSIANEVNANFVSSFSQQVTSSSISDEVYAEIRRIVLLCSHPLAAVRKASVRYLNDLVTSFPSLVCNASVVTVILELLTVLRRACQTEFLDEYTPVYSFRSVRGGFTLVLPDDYPMRNSVLTELHQYARAWLKAALTRAPYEMQGVLQEYIGPNDKADGGANYLADDDMGKSVAIDMTRMLPANDKGASLPPWGGWKSDNSARFAKSFGTRTYYGGEASRAPDAGLVALTAELDKVADQVRSHKMHFKLGDLRSLLCRAAAYLVKSEKPDVEVLRKLVSIPAGVCSEGAILVAQEVWTWVADSRPDLETRVMVEVAEAWIRTVQLKQGLFSSSFNRRNPLDQETQFTPTSKDDMTKELTHVSKLLQPHVILLSFLSSRFQAFRYRNRDLVETFVRLLLRSTAAASSWSTHQLTRELRLRFISFGFCVLQGSVQESTIEALLRAGLYNAALSWFAVSPGWSFGSNRVQLKSDLVALDELMTAVKGDVPSYRSFSTSQRNGTQLLPNGLPMAQASKNQASRQQLLLALLENEIDRIRLWINPLMDAARGPLPSTRPAPSDAVLRQLASAAWSVDPAIAVFLTERFKSPVIDAEVTRLVRHDPAKVEHVQEALALFIGSSITTDVRNNLKHLLYWAPVPVVSALRFLFPKFGGDAVLLQYALRVLEHHPVGVTFFYIPQVVQALRTDRLGYAERFIFETSKISQLFCHQIIWNMKANAYRGDDGEEPDPMKPALDRMIDMIVASLSGEAKDFFQREFAFFDEVTSISAKLKPYIKASKLEKKAKIDEEMAKITVDPGVYLPSNPDGVVVDIDRLSGRPLQSHAKAPFMATFKVRRERKTDRDAQEALIELEEDTEGAADVPGFDTWQSAIFKVGDDCRQDVLALQIIAMHKNIFTSLGLDLLVTPYRVTATGPGCGVIDVVPNATSRDEMGRAKVNDLRSFFIMKYGSPDGVHFQKARINFIQSMAAYSLLCYIVQIKDRHNGNIMIDGHGCITHIDFGFLFDIDESSSALLRPLCTYLLLPSSPFSTTRSESSPATRQRCIVLTSLETQGVKFEPSSFKLSHEMVVLMGGRNSVGFRMFSELTVKAFLAARPFGQAVVDTSTQMMDAGFPSYKGEATMTRLKERFRLDLSEKAAAEYMKGIIANACENPRSIVYDEFQRATNGIPYVR